MHLGLIPGTLPGLAFLSAAAGNCERVPVGQPLAVSRPTVGCLSADS